ncbi:hypothetical protein INR49_029525, partial [Caranx melampygus]
MDVHPQKQTILRSHVYRIPALLYEGESKTLLAFAEQRRASGDSNADALVMKTGTLKEESPGVKTIEWSDFKPVEEAKMDGHRTMNPCPVYEENNRTLFLFFICVESNVEESWQIRNNTNKACLCYITSQDLGQSWSDVTDLTDTLDEIKNWSTLAVGPGHGVQMKCGRLVIPVYGYVKNVSHAVTLYSDDNGDHWQFGKILQTKSNECEMAEFFDEEDKSFIYCNARNERGNRVEAISENGGDDFVKLSGALSETGNGCQGSVVSFPAQNEDADTEDDQNPKWLLFTHPSSQSRRIDLGVYLNKCPQDPDAWSRPWIINPGPSGYSDLAYTEDGWFVCLVESGEKTEIEQIASLVFSYNDIIQTIRERSHFVMTAAWITSHLGSLLFKRVETMSKVTLTDAQPQKVRQTVFKSLHRCVYRIPALLYETETETLLAFAEQRKAAADSSAKTLVMRSGKLKEEVPGVKTVEWSELKPVEEAQHDGHRTMNPCPVYEEKSKTLFLFFICVEGNVEEMWQIRNNTNKARLCYITSQDLGQSWSDVTDLTDTLDEIKNWSTLAVGPGHGVQMKCGRLVIPVYGYVKNDVSHALALYSDDYGKTWQFGKMLQTTSIECGMAEFFDEEDKCFVYCNARSHGGYRVEAVSEINGHEFAKLSGPAMLVETGRGCQGSVVSFPAQNEGSDNNQSKNKWLLFTHPSDRGKRIDLGVYLNKTPQDPNAWSKPWIINPGPSGYSDLAYIDDDQWTTADDASAKLLVMRTGTLKKESSNMKTVETQKPTMGNSPRKHLHRQRKTVYDSFVHRIPALLYVREGKMLLAFAEQRATAGDASAKLLVMRTATLKDESSDVEWSDFKPVNKARKDGHRTMNPCPVYEEKSKTLFLFFICVEGNIEELWQIRNNTNKARLCYITSQDLGQSWSDVTDLTDTLDEIKNWSTLAVGPGHGVQMKCGRLIIPVYAYISKCFSCCCPTSYALALQSDDSGKTWQFGKMLGSKSIECQMAEFSDEEGKSFLYCNARSKGSNRVEAVSENGGDDFSMLFGSLIETGQGCQGSLVSFPAQNEGSDTNQNKNEWLLFIHPSDEKKRVNLGVYLNKTPKDPNAWSKPWIINHGPSGYSDVVYIDDGWFVCLAERGEKTEIEQIDCWAFSYNDIKQGIGETEQRATAGDASAKLLVMRTGTLKDESSDVEWSDFKPVNKARKDGHRTMNPCPVYEEKSKTLFLFSSDLGQSWSDVTDLTDTLDEIKNWSTLAVGPGHGVQMKCGRLIIPVYAYISKCFPCCSATSYALALQSYDSGKTWQFGKMLGSKSTECQMAEFSEEGKSFLYCNARSTGGNRVEAVSENGGVDFSVLFGSLIETGQGCQGSVVSFPAQNEGSDTNQNKNEWLLFIHPSDEEKRVNLGVYLNKTPKDPNAWSKPWIINHGPSGYSDVVYIDDGWFVCLAERGEKTEIEQIDCWAFSYNDIKQGIGET